MYSSLLSIDCFRVSSICDISRSFFWLRDVIMVFYLNLCFIVNVMPFTVSGQPFRTMFYISFYAFL